jgi:hypothetical protein
MKGMLHLRGGKGGIPSRLVNRECLHVRTNGRRGEQIAVADEGEGCKLRDQFKVVQDILRDQTS